MYIYIYICSLFNWHSILFIPTGSHWTHCLLCINIHQHYCMVKFSTVNWHVWNCKRKMCLVDMNWNQQLLWKVQIDASINMIFLSKHKQPLSCFCLFVPPFALHHPPYHHPSGRYDHHYYAWNHWAWFGAPGFFFGNLLGISPGRGGGKI